MALSHHDDPKRLILALFQGVNRRQTVTEWPLHVNRRWGRLALSLHDDPKRLMLNFLYLNLTNLNLMLFFSDSGSDIASEIGQHVLYLRFRRIQN